MRSMMKVAPALFALGVCALLADGQAGAAQKKEKKKVVAANTLKVGEKAPEFQAVDENGRAWKSSDHVGKKIVVLYFFPAALTGG